MATKSSPEPTRRVADGDALNRVVRAGFEKDAADLPAAG
jgi:hypothetical protein